MHYTSSTVLLAILSARLQFTAALPADSLFDSRALVCNANNCLRAVRGASDADGALIFCQTFISSYLSTVTNTATATATSSPVQATITSLTGTLTETINFGCTTTIPWAPVNKRAAKSTPIASSISSACPSSGGVAQDARISSACSCYIASATALHAFTATTTNTVTSTLTTPPPTTILVPYETTATVSLCTSTQTITPTPQCADIGPVYKAANGARYNVHCNQIHGEQPLQLVFPGNIVACLEYCSTREGCVGASFDSSSGRCDTTSQWIGSAYDYAGGNWLELILS